MSKKQEFVNYVRDVFVYLGTVDAPVAPMNENAQAYWEALLEGAIKEEKPVLTDNGKQVLLYLQQNQDKTLWKARDIAEGLCISSRGVSGSLRKLVTDGFVEKMGENPTIYSITEKGKNFIIEN